MDHEETIETVEHSANQWPKRFQSVDITGCVVFIILSLFSKVGHFQNKEFIAPNPQA